MEAVLVWKAGSPSKEAKPPPLPNQPDSLLYVVLPPLVVACRLVPPTAST